MSFQSGDRVVANPLSTAPAFSGEVVVIEVGVYGDDWPDYIAGQGYVVVDLDDGPFRLNIAHVEAAS